MKNVAYLVKDWRNDKKQKIVCKHTIFKIRLYLRRNKAKPKSVVSKNLHINRFIHENFSLHF